MIVQVDPEQLKSGKMMRLPMAFPCVEDVAAIAVQSAINIHMAWDKPATSEIRIVDCEPSNRVTSWI